MHFLFSPGIFQKHPESLIVRSVERRSFKARSAVKEKMTAERRSPGWNRRSSFTSPFAVSGRQRQPKTRTECVTAQACVSSRVPQILGRHSIESEHPLLQPRMIGIRILDVKNSRQNPDPLFGSTARWAMPSFLDARAKGPFPPPSVTRIASLPTRDPARLQWPDGCPPEGSPPQWLPSGRGRPGLESDPGTVPVPRKPRKMPLSFEGLQKEVSSASTIPVSCRAVTASGSVRNRCRQLKAASLLIPQRQAAFLTDSPSFIPSM